MGVRRNFSRGEQRQHFVDPCQVADDAMQMYVHETLYHFYTHPKNMPHITTLVTKMHFVGSH